MPSFFSILFLSLLEFGRQFSVLVIAIKRFTFKMNSIELLRGKSVEPADSNADGMDDSFKFLPSSGRIDRDLSRTETIKSTYLFFPPKCSVNENYKNDCASIDYYYTFLIEPCGQNTLPA
jgi:hypothetical protein